MEGCLFCKIINKEIPSAVVYEDDKFLAFLDIHPVNFGHTLLISKEHHSNFLNTPDEILMELTKLVHKLAPVILQVTAAAGFNLTINNGSAAGQVIEHTHFHIIPRFYKDGLKSWGHKEYGSGEMLKLSEDIKKLIA